jgi:preprotein translocase subunit SecE
MSKQQHATADRETDEDELDEGSSASVAKSGTAARKKDRKMTAGAHWLFQTSLYKRNQGRITRQVTFGCLVLGLAIGCWRLSHLLMNNGRAWEIGFPLLVLAAGTWFFYRLVNLPRFADFLIAVEAEMAKVSWPTRAELIRSSAVVIVTIFGLAIILFGYDWFWSTLLKMLRVVG